MLLHVRDGRMYLIPCHVDRFSHFLRGACSVKLKRTGALELAQVLVYDSEKIHERLVLFEHAIHTSFSVAALKQVDKKGDEEEEGGNEKGDCFCFREDVHGILP